MNEWERGSDTLKVNLKYMDKTLKPPMSIKLHSHPNYEILYFHDGQGSYLIGDKIYELKKGDLIFMHGLTLHCVNLANSKTYIRSVIHFNPSYIKPAIKNTFSIDLLKPFEQLKNVHCSLNQEQQKEVEDILGKMNAYNNQHDEILKQRFYLALFDLLLSIYSFSRNKGAPETGRQTSVKLVHTQKIISYIEQFYKEDIRMDDMERALHLNKYYMAKLFKEVIGVTIFDYLYQRRINQAKILLYLNPAMKITDVSSEAGFKHPAHFSRLFKKTTGFAPKDYKITKDL